MRVEVPLHRDQERKEKIHDSIDVRARTLADLWLNIQDLSVPMLSDTPEQVNDQNGQLLGVIGEMTMTLPQINGALGTYNQMQEAMRGSAHSQDKEIRQEIKELVDGDLDLKFFLFVTGGAIGLAQRRKRIREFQEQFGEPQNNGHYTREDLDKFREIPEIPKKARKHITGVVISQFSVNIFIDSDTYNKVKSFNEDINSDGIHLGGNSIFNFISDKVASNIRKGVEFDFGKTTADLMTILRHEEFHSIEDAFSHSNSDFITEERRIKAMLATFANRRIIEMNPPFISFGKIEMPNEIDLSRIPDASTEELLAEISSVHNKEGIPLNTFAALDPRKRELIDLVLNDPIVRLTDVKIKTGFMQNIEELREEIRQIYDLTEDKIPERSFEVDALFVFIPVSQFSLIRKTVQRWVQESEVNK